MIASSCPIAAASETCGASVGVVAAILAEVVDAAGSTASVSG